jgi:hypothetical protein
MLKDTVISDMGANAGMFPYMKLKTFHHMSVVILDHNMIHHQGGKWRRIPTSLYGWTKNASLVVRLFIKP